MRMANLLLNLEPEVKVVLYILVLALYIAPFVVGVI